MMPVMMIIGLTILGLTHLGWNSLGLTILGLTILGLTTPGLTILGLMILELRILVLRILELRILGLRIQGLRILVLRIMRLWILGLKDPVQLHRIKFCPKLWWIFDNNFLICAGQLLLPGRYPGGIFPMEIQTGCTKPARGVNKRRTGLLEVTN